MRCAAPRAPDRRHCASVSGMCGHERLPETANDLPSSKRTRSQIGGWLTPELRRHQK